MRLITERAVASRQYDCPVCEENTVGEGEVYFRLTTFDNDKPLHLNLCYYCSAAYQSLIINNETFFDRFDLIEKIRSEYQSIKKLIEDTPDDVYELYN